jgi:HK97 gp10 family phage protein
MARRSKILGVPRLRRKLKRIDPEMRKEVAVAVDSTAKRLLAEMQTRVPVSEQLRRLKFGHLRDMLQAKSARNGLSARVGLLSKQSQQAGYYWRFLEYGTVKMPARPFVTPSVMVAEQEWQPKIRSAVDVALLRTAQSEPIEAGTE